MKNIEILRAATTFPALRATLPDKGGQERGMRDDVGIVPYGGVSVDFVRGSFVGGQSRPPLREIRIPTPVCGLARNDGENKK